MNQFQDLKYGPEMGEQRGWIGKLGEDQFLHRFGGQSWRTEAKNSIDKSPTLLLTLDLRDARLESLRNSDGDLSHEIPLCSYLNFTELPVQFYQIDSVNRNVHFLTNSPARAAGRPSQQLPSPLPERRIRLVPMESSHLPLDEATYWNACDSFVGGDSFIRVLGPPVWLQEPVTAQCQCGRKMDYVAAIGYERYDSPAGFLGNRAFIVGELALYFLLCRQCARISVLSQNT